MTSRTRLTAARLALRTDIRTAAERRLATLEAAVLERRAIAEARTMVRKSKTARLLNGAGDLWNGDDRAHQFLLLTEAARLRRAALAR